MPRKQLAAVAGHNLLFGPPGSPFPSFGGRGSPTARTATLSALSIATLAEMLFEGAAGADGVAFDEIRGNTVAIDDGAGVIVLGGEQFSHHALTSIQFNNVDQNYVRITTVLPTYFVFELWFRDTLTNGDFAAMLGEPANSNIHFGRGNTVGQHWPSVRNDFNGFLAWELQIDFSGDGLIHQLLEFRDTVAGLDYIVCVDGMPVASATNPPSNQSGGMINLIFTPSFNDVSGAAASERFGGEIGSFAVYDNGANLTLRDVRELYETSALVGRDILTRPRWFILDSSNCVVDPILAKQVDLGDVLNDTGIRSGAIPRTIPGVEDGRNTYFELEIIDQGDDATATLIGLRRFAEGGLVGGDPDNVDEAIYLKGGLLFDGGNFQLPIAGPVGVESGAILDAQMTASSTLATWEPELGRLNGPRAWLQPNPQVAGEWLQVDLLHVRTITEIKTQGNFIFNEWVISYKIEFAGEDLIFEDYNGGEILTGNTDRNSIVTNVLIPFQARYIRCLPETFQTSTSLRLEYTQAGDQDAVALGNPITGRVYRFAIPWAELLPTQFFIGDEINWKGLPPGPADPETFTDGIGFLNTSFNWGAWARTNGTSGNGKVRLRTKFYEMILPIPVGYDSWEPQSYTVEATPNGVNRRQSVFDFYPVQQVTQYLFEGGLSTYLLDTNDKRLNKGVLRDLADGAGTDPTFSGLQLSFTSVDSIRWPRTINAQATQPTPDPSVHAFELWYRQPDFVQTQCCLFTSTNNSRLGVGRGDGTRRFPSFHNNFNNFNFWESEVDLYGDDRAHQLIEAHDINTDYRVYIDGMPVASGTNPDGGWLDVGGRMILNAEQSNGVDQLSRSGGDFGSLISYIGGERLTQVMVRRLFEASVIGFWRRPEPALATDIELQCNFDGADGDSAYTEESNARVATFVNGAALSRAAKNGPTSLRLDGGANKYIHFPDSADFTIGASDFTIEGWGRMEILPVSQQEVGSCLASHYFNTGNQRAWFFAVETDETIKFHLSSDGISSTTVTTAALSWEIDRWYHFAVTREGNIVRIFRDGVLEVSTDVGAISIFNSTDVFHVGRVNTSLGFRRFWNGFIDDFRFTVGEAIYTAAFEPTSNLAADMLTNPRWFILDSVNCTVSAAPAKDLICGSVEDNTGARSGAIPRNGKVYFELEVVVQGAGTGTSNLGPRKLAEPSNVGNFPDVATDGYHTDGQGAIHDSDEVSIGITGTLGTSAVGRIFQIAIDWSTGDWWMGTDNTVYAGIGGVGNPSTGANPLPALDIEFNWAMGMNILNQFGGNTVRLITADADLNFAKPTGYVAWEDAI